jgi:hypothetical protein
VLALVIKERVVGVAGIEMTGAVETEIVGIVAIDIDIALVIVIAIVRVPLAPA